MPWSRQLAGDLKFFHWELEFPDVFTPQRSGFDAMIGNPPWDVMKPNSQEFFTEFDPLYRTYDKQAALRRQRELFQTVPGVTDQWDEYNARFKALGNWAKNVAEPFDLSLARGREGESLQRQWAKHRSEHVGYADRRHPFRLQGSADLNSYKMFAEVFWSLLKTRWAAWSDPAHRHLLRLRARRTCGRNCFSRGRIDLLYAFQNEKRVFAAADHRYKQVVVLACEGRPVPRAFRTRFRMGVGDSPEAHEIPDDLLRNDSAAMVFTPDDVRKNSPKSLSLVELRSPRDLAIFRKIYDHSIRIGDNAPGWEITYAREFDMTNDSSLFPPLEKWEAKEYRSDVFGRWIGPVMMWHWPLYEGSMIHQFDFCYQSWLEGHGAGSLWSLVQAQAKTIGPRFLIDQDHTSIEECWPKQKKVCFRFIGRNTLTRTLLSTCLSDFPCGNSLSILRCKNNSPFVVLLLQAFLNSFCSDFVVRSKISGLNLNWFVISDCPIPNASLRPPGLLSNWAGVTSPNVHTPRFCSRLAQIQKRLSPNSPRRNGSTGGPSPRQTGCA